MKFKTWVFIKTSEFAIIDINTFDYKVTLYTSKIPTLLPEAVTRQEFIDYIKKTYSSFEFDFNFEDLELIEVELTTQTVINNA